MKTGWLAVCGAVAPFFGASAKNASPSLFLSEESRRHVVRFSTDGNTYRVYYSLDAGAGVEILDAKGRKIGGISCTELPHVYDDYLRSNLPCDPKSPGACRKP